MAEPLPLPGGALVTSPMRSGSTWVHEMLVFLHDPVRTDFVDWPAQAAALARESSVLKSHSIAGAQLLELPPTLRTVRVLRNFKDSLISRALYCRHVRPAEGLANQDDESAVIAACAGQPDDVYVRTALRDEALLQRWMEHLAAFTYGDYGWTFRYEMLLHDARAEFEAWLRSVGWSGLVAEARLEAALAACSFSRMRHRSTPGFIGSTGIGRWITMLDEALAAELDGRWRQCRGPA